MPDRSTPMPLSVFCHLWHCSSQALIAQRVTALIPSCLFVLCLGPHRIKCLHSLSSSPMRRNQDPIAEHSARLCEYMNSRPSIVLSYARYFGEYPEATTATMTSVDQDGFELLCLDQGQEQEVRVTFSHSLHAPSQVRDALTDLAKEAETALRGKDPDSQVHEQAQTRFLNTQRLLNSSLLLLALF